MTGGRAACRHRSRATRLAAVQALYQLDLGTGTLDQALALLGDGHATLDERGRRVEIDAEASRAVVRGVAAHPDGRLDTLIDGALAEGWRSARLESLVRVILRAGLHELVCDLKVPARVVIDEYMHVAHAFFVRGEPGMINAVLDRLARRLRPAEFDAAGEPRAPWTNSR